MAYLDLVEELMSKVLTPLDIYMPVSLALSEMDKANTEYGIVFDAEENIVGLISKNTLTNSPNHDLELLNVPLSHPILIEPNMVIDDAVRMLAKDFVIDPEIEGVIVHKDDIPVGFLTRDLIKEHAKHLKTKSIVDQLGGPPINMLFYKCKSCLTRKLIMYYDPENPPTCRCGKRMEQA